MNKLPTVSIIITCYNYGRYVEEAIKSVLNQTFSDFELIIINDGSTDDSDQRIRSSSGDQRIKYIYQANAGQTRAKNRGIEESTGRFVAFLDADDYWHPLKLEKQLPLFEESSVGVVYSRARYIGPDGKDLNFKIEECGKYLAPKRGRVTNELLMDNFVPFSSAVIRREALGAGFDENLRMSIDWKLWLWISLEWMFDFVDEGLLYYRMGHEGQMSKNMEGRWKHTEVILDEFIMKNEKRLNKDAVKKALAHRHYQRWNYYIDRDLRLAWLHLKEAVRYQVDPLRIARGLVNKIRLGL